MGVQKSQIPQFARGAARREHAPARTNRCWATVEDLQAREGKAGQCCPSHDVEMAGVMVGISTISCGFQNGRKPATKAPGSCNRTPRASNRNRDSGYPALWPPV